MQAGDGVFAVSQDGFIQLVDLKHNSTRILVASADMKDVRFNDRSRRV
jgi:dipeptidyl aminopeptidase